MAAVACGSGFTVCLGKETGGVYTFGGGGSSCLGHGNKTFTPQPVRVEALAEESVLRVACGHRHAFALAK